MLNTIGNKYTAIINEVMNNIRIKKERCLMMKMKLIGRISY